jgi:hypothetical protein
MRQAKHLHPEWGILAPPPSFSRTIRVFVIATFVGAATGSAAIMALADRVPDQMSVAARTLATSSEAGAIAAPPVLTAPAQAPLPLPGARAKSRSIVEAAPTRATLLSVAPTKPVDYSTPAQKKANKKHHAGPRYASRGREFTSLMDDWYHAVGL